MARDATPSGRLRGVPSTSDRTSKRTFTRAELESFRDAEVPDLLPGPDDPPLRLLFVGINPGLWTAATSTHFAYPGNRFYPALFRAGIIDEPIDPAAGMTDADRDRLRSRGIGITNVVRRATAKASELSREEFRAGGLELVATVRRTRPAVVAIAGITAYRSAFGLPKAVPGRQPSPLEEAELWVVPNPSGLNAHETVASLAEAYAAPAQAAGVI
jgi:TDG/mug DNA glycosylase family protein